MNGDSLVIRVREILRDVVSNVHQGEFWSDLEIKLALNAAQAVFVNTCLRLRLHYLLSGLMTSVQVPAITVPTPLPRPNPNRWRLLPVDYMHYVSGVTQLDPDGTMLRLARIYLGASSHIYKTAAQDAIFIHDGRMTAIAGSDPYTAFVLHYFRQPAQIGLTSLGDDTQPWFPIIEFSSHVYDDIIAGHASVLLGMKETQTQREFKNFKNIFSQYTIFPKRLLNFITDVEKLRELIEAMTGGK